MYFKYTLNMSKKVIFLFKNVQIIKERCDKTRKKKAEP